MNNDWNLDLPDWHLGTPPDLISGRVCVIWYMDDYEFGMWGRAKAGLAHIFGQRVATSAGRSRKMVLVAEGEIE